jgi:hypothetical protein
MGIFGIGNRSAEPPRNEPEKNEPKFTPKEIEQLAARTSEQGTTKESRAILETMAKADDGTTRRFAQEKLNHLGGLSDEEKAP